ncbi:hypothetical protein [Flavobacterium fluviatile]|uniref:hypothetical protein n=1 Tax=Flavobacterium fluviatile TaxID=1862387 RepID=UPI0013D6C34D|nr:hypothetical protein [Flavobacterium fluviatile]
MYLYPKIFDNADAKKENWSKFKVETFEDVSKTDFVKTFLPLVLFNLLLVGFGWRNFRKEKQIV